MQIKNSCWNLIFLFFWISTNFTWGPPGGPPPYWELIACVRAALQAREYNKGSNLLWSPPEGSGRLKEAAVLALAFHFAPRAGNRESVISSESSQTLALCDKPCKEQQVRGMFLQLSALTQSKWQWGSCNILVLGLPKPQHPFIFQSGRLALAPPVALTAQPVWFALAFWESCHVAAHIVPARLHGQCSSLFPRPQSGSSVSAQSCLFHLSFDQCHHDGHGYHCGWSQSSLLPPFKGFQSLSG